MTCREPRGKPDLQEPNETFTLYGKCFKLSGGTQSFELHKLCNEIDHLSFHFTLGLSDRGY